MVFDALLPVLGEISQHFERHYTDRDLIFVCPHLHGDQHHTCVQLIFEDLPLMCETKKGRQKKRQTEEMAHGEENSLNLNGGLYVRRTAEGVQLTTYYLTRKYLIEIPNVIYKRNLVRTALSTIKVRRQSHTSCLSDIDSNC